MRAEVPQAVPVGGMIAQAQARALLRGRTPDLLLAGPSQLFSTFLLGSSEPAVRGFMETWLSFKLEKV